MRRYVVRASELFGVLVLRAAWVVDESGTKVAELAVPPHAKRALFLVLIRRICAPATFYDALTSPPVAAALAIIAATAAYLATRSPAGAPEKDADSGNGD